MGTIIIKPATYDKTILLPAFFLKLLLNFFKSHNIFPDLIIECHKERHGYTDKDLQDNLLLLNNMLNDIMK